MTNFEQAFQWLIGNEGGYSNNPHDAGAETMWGVTARVARAHGYIGPMRNLPIETARIIAKSEYWDVYQCDALPFEVAFQVFDCAYNGGHPAQWLQRAVGVAEDGKIGPATLAAVNSIDPDKIVMRFDAARLRYLALLKDWPTFGEGWVNRIATNLERAAS